MPIEFNMIAVILLPLVVALVISFLSTPIVKSFAYKLGAIDVPKDERRMHKANSSPFTADAGGEPSAALYDRGYLFCGSIFTMPYWTARYYNLLDDTGRK